MIAAIYARKSNAQNGVADEASGVSRQVGAARAFAARRGWTVDETHVYTDDAVSGAEFAKRRGLVRLLGALKPRAAFSALLIADRDRIGREQIETSYILKQLLTAGVRVFECQGEGREITLGSPTDKIIMAVQDFAAEVEREKARSRTYSAMLHRARTGRPTGGRVFGYTTTRTPTGTITREIVPAEAQVIRAIFERAAEGWGVKRIAAFLNETAAPAPMPRRRGRPTGWAPSSVREVLHRDMYIGVLLWNRTRKRDTWGQKRQSERPEPEWLRVEAPDLRIVPEET
jgi:site-specific DNA recombinase